MKPLKFILITFFYFFSSNIQGKNKSIICGKINSPDKFIVHIYEPIHGYYNIAFLDTTSLNSSLLNSNDSLYKIINIDHPAFVTVYITNEKKEFISRIDVLMFPGDSLHLNIDLSHDDINSITYGGNNSMGQKLFNEINFQPYNKFIPVFDVLDKLPNNKRSIVHEIESIPLALKARFDSLQKKSLITKAFVEYINVCFKSLIYDQVVLSFLRESKKMYVISRREKDSILTTLYKNQPPEDKRLKGLYASYFYLYNYYNFLTWKKYHLKSINELTAQPIDYRFKNHNYLIKEDFVPFTYIQNEADRETLWALYTLLLFNYPGKYDFSVIKQYDSIFSKNKWSQLLRKKLEYSGTPIKIKYKLQSPIQIIDTNGILSLHDLLNRVSENQPLFIDIWATWCGPCIAAFGFNQMLDSFLIHNNIQLLYISLDDEYNYLKWKQAIDKYGLGGYHIIASDSLKNDIKKIIYKAKGNEGMGIPRYVLVNDGKIIINNAFSPTEFELLKKQITTVLKNN